jgi:hypothetical protein
MEKEIHQGIGGGAYPATASFAAPMHYNSLLGSAATASNLRNTETTADLPGQQVWDFGMSRNRFDSAGGGVHPE